METILPDDVFFP